MIFEAVRTVLGDLLESVSELLVRESVSFVKQLAKIAEYLFDCFYIPLVAVDEQLIAASTDINVEQRFEIFDVLILYAEQRVEAL